VLEVNWVRFFSHLLFVISAFIIYLLSNINHVKFENEFPTEQDIQFSGIYFAAIVVSEFNLTRIETEFSSWGNNINFFSKDSVFIPIATFTLGNQYHKTVIYKKPNDTKKKHYIIYGYKKAMNDFYYNTSLNWFFRLTDDVYVNMRNFGDLVNSLEAKYDPLTDVVIKGQLCASFVHGGSGWIMSRKAVEDVLKVWDNVNLDEELADDVIAPLHWKKIGVDLRDTHSDKFIGSRIHNSFVRNLENRDWKDLWHCRGTKYSRVDSVAVWHAGSNSMNVVVHGDELIRTVPNNVYCYIEGDAIGFCTK
jgi:hypothetical protein